MTLLEKMKLTENEKRTILETSLERVLNNALWIAGKGLNSRNTDLSERCGILIDDLEGQQAVALIADKLWSHVREEIMKGNL